MTPPRPPRHLFAILVAVTFISPLANHMFIPAMPAVKADFGIGDELAFAALSVTMMTMAVTTIVYGGFSDQWGRKRVLLAGLALYTAGAALCWLAPDIRALLAGRVLQGAGAGCGIVLARAIARDLYGMERIASVIANLTAAYVLGPLLAPTIGAFLAAAEGWRALFLLVAALGLALAALVLWRLPETHRPERAVPAAAILGGVARNYGRLMRVARFNAYAMLPGFQSGSFFALAAASAFLARETLGVSMEAYGVWFLLMPVGFVSGNLLSGRIGNRVSVTRMTIGGTGLNLAVMLGAWLCHDLFGLSMALMMGAGFGIGLAQGLSMPYAQAGAMEVDPALAGSASGAVVFCQLFFAGAAEQVVGLVADGTFYPVLAVMLSLAALAFAAAVAAAATRPAAA